MRPMRYILEPGGNLPVHLLRLQHICPRLAYLSTHREPAPPVEVLARHEMSLSIPGMKGDVEALLRERWEALPVELPAIYPGLEPGEVESELSTSFPDIDRILTAWGKWSLEDPRAAAVRGPDPEAFEDPRPTRRRLPRSRG